MGCFPFHLKKKNKTQPEVEHFRKDSNDSESLENLKKSKTSCPNSSCYPSTHLPLSSRLSSLSPNYDLYTAQSCTKSSQSPTISPAKRLSLASRICARISRLFSKKPTSPIPLQSTLPSSPVISLTCPAAPSLPTSPTPVLCRDSSSPKRSFSICSPVPTTIVPPSPVLYCAHTTQASPRLACASTSLSPNVSDRSMSRGDSNSTSTRLDLCKEPTLTLSVSASPIPLESLVDVQSTTTPVQKITGSAQQASSPAQQTSSQAEQINHPVDRITRPDEHIACSVQNTLCSVQQTISPVQCTTKLILHLGFPNIGNTCYMNSILQCMMGIPSFHQNVTKQDEAAKASHKPAGLVSCLAKLQRARFSEENKEALLFSIKGYVGMYNPDFLDYDQQDAHEFLMILLNILKMERSSIVNCPMAAFEFQILNMRTCNRCGSEVCSTEDFNVLSLNLSSSLIQSLSLYFKATEIECRCDKCNATQANLEKQFVSLPRVLALHIVRFSMIGGLQKLNDAMFFPSSFTLPLPCEDTAQRQSSSRPNSVGDVSRTLGQRSPTPASPVKLESPEKLEQRGDHLRDLDRQTVYHLSAVVSHVGDSMFSGHYISDVVMEPGRQWHTMSDQWVGHTEDVAVQKDRAKTAYILFYVQREADEVAQVHQEESQKMQT